MCDVVQWGEKNHCADNTNTHHTIRTVYTKNTYSVRMLKPDSANQQNG